MENIINCPYCEVVIIIEKKNCGIFRCGIIKKSGKQIPPHSKKERCDKLFNEGLIWGCGKPFKINKLNNQIEKCDYI